MNHSRSDAHVVYIVYWPGLHTVKAGYSSRRRWRAFLKRGAQIVDCVPFGNSTDAFEFESLILRRLKTVGTPAFSSALHAEPHLGGRGGGWCECYRLPDGITPMGLLQSTDWSLV